MSPISLPPPPWRPFFILTLWLGAIALAWDGSGLDLPVMHLLGDAQGFALRHNHWLEHVLHDDMRRAATVVFVAALGWLAWAPGRLGQLPRSERALLALGLLMSLLAVNLVKRYSLTSCPWDLQAFGGVASYVSHWTFGVADGGGGQCFPGGHASSFAALFPLVLPALASRDAAARRHGRLGLALLIAATAVLGLVQTLRGAHYPSHTLWTIWLCWSAGGLPWAARAAWLHWRSCPGTPNSNSITSTATAPRA